MIENSPTVTPTSTTSQCAVCGEPIQIDRSDDGVLSYWVHSDSTKKFHAAAPVHPPGDARQVQEAASNNVCGQCGLPIQFEFSAPGLGHWLHSDGTNKDHVAMPANLCAAGPNDVVLKDRVNVLRSAVKLNGVEVKALLHHPFFFGDRDKDSVADLGEMRANVMLAYRHLEDSAMRMGKILQAMDGGVSCYDKK